MAFKRPPTHTVNCHSTIVEVQCKPHRTSSNRHELNQNGLSMVMNLAGIRWLSNRAIRRCTNLVYRHGIRKHCVVPWRKENSMVVHVHVHVLVCTCSCLFLEINSFLGERTEVERIKSMQRGTPPLRCCWVIYEIIERQNHLISYEIEIIAHDNWYL